MVPHIKNLLSEFTCGNLKALQEELDSLEELCSLIKQAIVEEPPVSVREGGIIREGYHEEADKLRHAKTEGKTWLAQLETRERDKTGIKNLKIKIQQSNLAIILKLPIPLRNLFRNILSASRP